jgi:hypothetical protein
MRPPRSLPGCHDRARMLATSRLAPASSPGRCRPRLPAGANALCPLPSGNPWGSMMLVGASCRLCARMGNGKAMNACVADHPGPCGQAGPPGSGSCPPRLLLVRQGDVTWNPAGRGRRARADLSTGPGAARASGGRREHRGARGGARPPALVATRKGKDRDNPARIHTDTESPRSACSARMGSQISTVLVGIPNRSVAGRQA